jgi:hypothetical protein
MVTKRKQKKIKCTEEDGVKIYELMVHFMWFHFNGPKHQRTPTTTTAKRIAHTMTLRSGKKLCYEMCREYLSNELSPVK